MLGPGCKEGLAAARLASTLHMASMLEAVNRLGFILTGELVASLLVWLYGWPAGSLYVAAYGLFTWFPLIPAGTAMDGAPAFASASSVAAVAIYARARAGKNGGV